MGDLPRRSGRLHAPPPLVSTGDATRLDRRDRPPRPARRARPAARRPRRRRLHRRRPRGRRRGRGVGRSPAPPRPGGVAASRRVGASCSPADTLPLADPDRALAEAAGLVVGAATPVHDVRLRLGPDGVSGTASGHAHAEGDHLDTHDHVTDRVLLVEKAADDVAGPAHRRGRAEHAPRRHLARRDVDRRVHHRARPPRRSPTRRPRHSLLALLRPRRRRTPRPHRCVSGCSATAPSGTSTAARRAPSTASSSPPSATPRPHGARRPPSPPRASRRPRTPTTCSPATTSTSWSSRRRRARTPRGRCARSARASTSWWRSRSRSAPARPTRCSREAADADLLAVVYQNRRFDPDHLAVRRAVRSGALGDVFHIETFVGGYGHPCNLWHSDEGVSGGAFYDWGSHVLDQILDLVPTDIEHVTAASHKRRWFDVTNADHSRVTIRFVDGVEAEFVALRPRGRAQAALVRARHRGRDRQPVAHRADRVAHRHRHPRRGRAGARGLALRCSTCTTATAA